MLLTKKTEKQFDTVKSIVAQHLCTCIHRCMSMSKIAVCSFSLHVLSLVSCVGEERTVDTV